MHGAPYAHLDEVPHFDRWLRKWHRLFTFQTEGEDRKWHPMEIPREQLEAFVPKVRIALCRVWIERDARQRDWYFYRLRDTYHRMIVRAENPYLLDFSEDGVKQFEELSRARRDNPRQKARLLEEMTGEDLLEYAPRVCPFEAAVYWLQVNQRLMLNCAGPICPAPYFFRTERGRNTVRLNARTRREGRRSCAIGTTLPPRQRIDRRDNLRKNIGPRLTRLFIPHHAPNSLAFFNFHAHHMSINSRAANRLQEFCAVGSARTQYLFP